MELLPKRQGLRKRLVWYLLSAETGKGATYQAAVRALTFKWIRILYRRWKDNTPNDELLFLNTQKRNRSLLLNRYPDTKTH